MKKARLMFLAGIITLSIITYKGKAAPVSSIKDDLKTMELNSTTFTQGQPHSR